MTPHGGSAPSNAEKNDRRREIGQAENGTKKTPNRRSRRLAGLGREDQSRDSNLVQDGSRRCAPLLCNTPLMTSFFPCGRGMSLVTLDYFHATSPFERAIRSLLAMA